MHSAIDLLQAARAVVTRRSAIADKRAAGWVSFGQKLKAMFCRKYRSIFNHCDVIKETCKTTEFGEIKQNKGCYAVQGH